MSARAERREPLATPLKTAKTAIATTTSALTARPVRTARASKTAAHHIAPKAYAPMERTALPASTHPNANSNA